MKLTLREVLESDLPTLYEHQSDPEAYRMAEFLPRDEPAFMKHWKERVFPDTCAIKRAIVVDGEVVGQVSSFVREGKREVGYWIGRAYWGRGIASEALQRFLDDEDRSRPLFAFVAKSNVASRRVAEKCGFVVIGEASGPPGGRGPVVEDWVLRLELG